MQILEHLVYNIEKVYEKKSKLVGEGQCKSILNFSQYFLNYKEKLEGE